MSVRLPWQSRSSVISAGFKPSPETHIALMVHGQQQKGFVAFYNVCYLCTMGVLSLVTGGGWRRHRYYCTQQRRKLRETFPNCNEQRTVMYQADTVREKNCSSEAELVRKHDHHWGRSVKLPLENKRNTNGKIIKQRLL